MKLTCERLAGSFGFPATAEAQPRGRYLMATPRIWSGAFSAVLKTSKGQWRPYSRSASTKRRIGEWRVGPSVTDRDASERAPCPLLVGLAASHSPQLSLP